MSPGVSQSGVAAGSDRNRKIEGRRGARRLRLSQPLLFPSLVMTPGSASLLCCICLTRQVILNTYYVHSSAPGGTKKAVLGWGCCGLSHGVSSEHTTFTKRFRTPEKAGVLSQPLSLCREPEVTEEKKGRLQVDRQRWQVNWSKVQAHTGSSQSQSQEQGSAGTEGSCIWPACGYSATLIF